MAGAVPQPPAGVLSDLVGGSVASRLAAGPRKTFQPSARKREVSAESSSVSA